MQDESDAALAEEAKLLREFRIVVVESEPIEQHSESRRCLRCKAVLSRYNPDNVCWPCQAK